MTGPLLTEEITIKIRTLAGEEARRVLASVTDELKKQRQGSALAMGEFQKLAQEQRQVTADFRAGLKTQQEYRAEMQRLRASAIDLRNTGLAPVGKELSAFSSLTVQTATTSAQAARVLNTMRNSLSQVAAQALGVSGRFGTLISAALPLGISGGAALALVGAASLISKAYDMWAASTERVRKEHEALITTAKAASSAIEINAASIPLLTRKNQIEADLGAQHEVAQPGGGFKMGPLVTGEKRTALEDDLRQVTAQLQALKLKMDEVSGTVAETVTDLVRDLADKVSERAAKVVAAQKAKNDALIKNQLEGFHGGMVDTTGAVVGAARSLRENIHVPARTGLSRSDAGRLNDVLMGNAARPFTADTGDTGNKSLDKAANAASNALSHMAQMALSGGNAIQALSAGVSSVLQDLIGKSLGPFGGLVAGLGGGLLGKILGGGKPDRVNTQDAIPVRVAAISDGVLNDLSKRIVPTQIDIFRGDPANAEQARVRLRDAEQRDRSTIVPRSSAAA